MVRRHESNPSDSPASDAARGQRRQLGGLRREASERVSVLTERGTISGWTLNLSRGGVRLVLEDPLSVGVSYDLVFEGDGGSSERRRPGRVVWTQDEPDGQIVGVQFLDVPLGSLPPKPDTTG
jgi:hypothetical protein